MVSRKVNNFLIGLAACKYLIVVGLIIWFIVSNFRVILLPVGEERYYERTDIMSDGGIEGARPVLYVNVVSTDEKLESALSFLDLRVTDTQVKAKQSGMRMLNLYHYGPDQKKGQRIYYIFIVYEP